MNYLFLLFLLEAMKVVSLVGDSKLEVHAGAGGSHSVGDLVLPPDSSEVLILFFEIRSNGVDGKV